MNENADTQDAWATDVVQAVRRYYAAGRSDFFVEGVKLVDVAVHDERLWLATRNPAYAEPVGLVRSVQMMAAGFDPPLDPDSAAQILAGEVATPPEVERLTWRAGVGWWGELP